MKYYAVTEDPRELYHYGRLGMKWGQHIFGNKPKSSGYYKAASKLKSLAGKPSKSTVGTVKSIGATIKKSAAQVSANHRAAQEKRFNKAIEKSQKRFDKIDAKIDNYYNNVKPVIDARKAAIKQDVKQGFKTIASFTKNAPGQIAYNVRRHEENRYQKAVQKAQQRNKLSDALRSLDREDKFRKQVDRDRKMEELREKQSDIMADNDLKTLRKAVKVEKNMPKYYQQARTGELQYGKLSDEQIGRLQNRLVLEANTRRLGGTEEPSWRAQKKAARRQGYLQGITKGTSAAMEEVAKAGVQYGIANIANRKKLDNASAQKAKREKEATRIKNKKTHSEMREDLRDQAYEAQIKEGVHAIQRGAISARGAAKQLRYADRKQRERQNAINEANEERKFLRDEKHNAIRDENKFLRDEKHNAIRDEKRRKKNLAESTNDADEIGRQLYKVGFAAVPVYKDGKKVGTRLLTANGSSPNKQDNSDAKAYLKLYESKYKTEIEKEQREKEAEQRRYVKSYSNNLKYETDKKQKEQERESKAAQARQNRLENDRQREQEARQHNEALTAFAQRNAEATARRKAEGEQKREREAAQARQNLQESIRQREQEARQRDEANKALAVSAQRNAEATARRKAEKTIQKSIARSIKNTSLSRPYITNTVMDVNDANLFVPKDQQTPRRRRKRNY